MKLSSLSQFIPSSSYRRIQPKHVGLSQSAVSLSADPIFKSFEFTMLGESLNTNTITHDSSSLLESHEISHSVLCESVFTADENHLAAWELILGASEGELSDVDEFWLGSD